MKNQKTIIFDIDGCLITTDKDPKPRLPVIAMMTAFKDLGWKIYVHSGGGVQYAESWVRRLKLDEYHHITITPKGSPDYEFDIAVDDMPLEKDNLLAEEQGRKYRIKAKYYIQV